MFGQRTKFSIIWKKNNQKNRARTRKVVFWWNRACPIVFKDNHLIFLGELWQGLPLRRMKVKLTALRIDTQNSRYPVPAIFETIVIYDAFFRHFTIIFRRLSIQRNDCHLHSWSSPRQKKTYLFRNHGANIGESGFHNRLPWILSKLYEYFHFLLWSWNTKSEVF